MLCSRVGTKMQYTSYLPGYYHPKDLNGGLTGNSWSTPHNDIIWNNARGFYVSLPPFIGDQNLELAHQKEILKQTILKHEAIFRYQVKELHRVYRRQRELMDEIKRRKLVEDHLHLQAVASNSSVSHLRSEGSQKTHWPLVDLTCIEPSAPCREMFQGSSYSIAGQIVQPGADLFTEQNVTKDWNVSSSKSSASRKRMLDLELPAEEYLDNEDEEQFVEESPVQGSNILISELQPQHSSKVNLVNPGDSSISNSSPRSTFLLFDLNEPVQPHETECLNSAPESINVHEEISNMDQDLSGTVHAECSTLKKEVTGGDVSNVNSFDEVSSVESVLLPSNQTASSPPRIVDKSNDGTKTDKSLLVSPPRKLKEIPVAVQALPCFSTTASPRKSPKSSAGKSSLARKKVDLCNSGASSPTSGTSVSLMKYGDNYHTSGQTDAVNFSKYSDSMNSLKGMDLNCTPSADLSDDQFSAPTSSISHVNHPECRERGLCEKSDSVLESRKSTRNDNSVGLGNDSKALTTNTCIRSSSIKGETLSSGDSEATMTTADRDLDAPVSPENKEGSPPRGDSQDNLISTSVQWSEREGMSNHTGEPDKAAAEMLLLFSSSVVQGHAKTAMGEPSEASHDSLGWLADIAASLASAPVKEVRKLMNLQSDRNALTSDRIDCNEVMKRQLRGGNMDNYGHQLKKGSQKEAGRNTLHSQPRRIRTRSANNRRVLQKEAPPAASVSLHQLNEDLLAIGGLKLPAHAASESGTWTRTPRRASLRSRGWSHIGERITCSLLQPQSSNNKQGTAEKSWKCWGVTKGRRKDRRARSCISPLFS